MREDHEAELREMLMDLFGEQVAAAIDDRLRARTNVESSYSL